MTESNKFFYKWTILGPSGAEAYIASFSFLQLKHFSNVHCNVHVNITRHRRP